MFLLKDSELREDLQSWRKLTTPGRRFPRIGVPREIHGYSMVRVLIFGLILPAIVTAFTVMGLALAFWFGLPLLAKLLIISLTALVGFIFGTFVILNLRRQMLNFARIKKER